MRYPLRYLAAAFAVTGLAAFTGCQDATTYETQKPVIDNPPAEETVDEHNDYQSFKDDAEEAADDVADTVTPDRPVVDVDTPIGNVQVDEDPATGRKRVDVDTPRTDVDVDTTNDTTPDIE